MEINDLPEDSSNDGHLKGQSCWNLGAFIYVNHRVVIIQDVLIIRHGVQI